MESYHFKYGQCENCGSAIEDVGLLQIINFWEKIDSRLIPYYLYVCDKCFDSRNIWCENIFPDYCEICNEIIEDGEHYLEKTVNKEKEDIKSFGLAKNEKCRIICVKCHESNNKTSI